MMKVITCNLNGIRSASRKGFFTWLEAEQADVVCLQETKAQMQHLTDPIFRPQGYHCYFHDAEKKGYSGVGLYVKHLPKSVKMGLDFEEADTEGRYIEADLGHIKVASLYLPSGTSGETRQAVKYRFMEKYTPYLKKVIANKKPMIICGDWNIAHRAIDLKNWRANQKSSGFLPEERAWLDTLFDKLGWVDAFRAVNSEPDQYTWWSFRGQARAKNVGWRIDYQLVTPALKAAIQSATIYKDTLFSDHAPLIMTYDTQFV